MMNSYTFEVYRKQGKPVFVVTIEHVMHVGAFFFRSMQEAKAFVMKEKERLSMYAELAYNANGCTDASFIYIIKEVMQNDDLRIGTNGRTYSKTMFPNGI